jgi:parallel beta-helix repeat protein
MKYANNIIFFGLMALFVGAGFIEGVLGDTTIIIEEVWVDDDYCEGCYNDGHTWGYDAFDTIQDGIDAVNENGSVIVFEGTYTENVEIHKKIMLRVEGERNLTRIDGAGGLYCLKINKNADTCVIEGFTCTNASFGIVVQSHANMIQNTLLCHNNFGMYVHDSNSSIITNNKIINNSYGLHLNASHSNEVYENEIVNNTVEGIRLFFSYDNSIHHNIISNNACGFELGGYKNKIWRNSIHSNSELGIHSWATCANSMYENNFMDNSKDASFSHVFLIGYSNLIDLLWINNNQWFSNYWNEPRLLPKIIHGYISIYYDLENIKSWTVPWYEVDWFPSREPFNIQI